MATSSGAYWYEVMGRGETVFGTIAVRADSVAQAAHFAQHIFEHFAEGDESWQTIKILSVRIITVEEYDSIYKEKDHG